MPYYEVTYETGRMSVAYYEDAAEAEIALKQHNDRAGNALAGGPVAAHPSGVPGVPNWPAERIHTVRVYSRHPDEYNPEQTASSDVLKKEVEGEIARLADENGVVNIQELALAVRALSHPMVPAREGSFDSMFKMEEDEILDLGFLG